MLGPHTHRDNPLSRIMCAPITPPVTVCYTTLHYERLLFCFSGNFFPSVSCKMKKRNTKTNTGEDVKGKRGRTVSDDAGGKSSSDTSTSVCGQCVGESSTGAKSTVILGWTLETWAENFPCHQCMPVSNLYAKTSGRTWRIGGSQI
jgi:hypothetical protein